ncbi:MAG: pitrilysin family protein [bacterium]|nr:pitrilysin family protein [bacterium]
MNTGRYILLVFLLCLVILQSAPMHAQEHYEDLEYPALNEIQVPEVTQVTLSNGMRLFLLEDHELPLISVSSRIRVGSCWEPAEKIGLAGITGSVMRTGGTTTRTGDEIDEELEYIAASVETSIGKDAGSASMSVLKEDVVKGLEILADILMNPAFPDDKIELAQVQQRSSIARRNEKPGTIAFREFGKLIYGTESVFARHTEYATVNSITRDDLVAFHRSYFRPNNMFLAASGDFDTAEMIGKIEAAFAGWEKGRVLTTPVPEVNYSYRQTVNLVKKEDVNQATIVMGHIGGRMDDPDFFPLILMNRILGIGFNSRMFKEIRSHLGLAYSATAKFSAKYDHPGLFYVYCATASGNTVKAIRAMREEIKKITREEVTDEELDLARKAYLNSFVFKFAAKRKIVNRLMGYAYHGYPLDFLEKIKKNIENVTKADILRVAEKHLQPDRMQLLAVGRSEDFDESLSVLGKVNAIDVSIPEQKP